MIIFQGKVDDYWIGLTKKFLSLLPLKYDTEETNTISKLVFQKVLENHALLTNSSVLEDLKQSIRGLPISKMKIRF